MLMTVDPSPIDRMTAESRQLKTGIGHDRRPNAPARRSGSCLPVAAIIAVAWPSAAAASAKRAVVTVQTVQVGAPGNPSVGIVPFTDAIYQSCADAHRHHDPPASRSAASSTRIAISQLETTVKQYVAFLNTADPGATDRHDLYDATESSSAWPKYGQINKSGKAGKGQHYSVAYPEWADKPYGFANFPRAARFVNSLYNGRLLSKNADPSSGLVTYKVRLSRETSRGMYDLNRHKRTGATRASKRGFVDPEPGRVDQGRLLRPHRRRHLLLLEVSDQRGRLR